MANNTTEFNLQAPAEDFLNLWNTLPIFIEFADHMLECENRCDQTHLDAMQEFIQSLDVFMFNVLGDSTQAAFTGPFDRLRDFTSFTFADCDPEIQNDTREIVEESLKDIKERCEDLKEKLKITIDNINLPDYKFESRTAEILDKIRNH